METTSASFRFDELLQDCRASDLTPTPDTSRLVSIWWRYPANAEASYGFDVWLTRLAVLTE